MGYKILVSPRAQVEIEEAINFYLIESQQAPADFIQSLEATYQSLSINPFHRIQYKNIRALKIHKFPFSLYFIINRTKKTVRVLSCFHNKRSPGRRPKG